MFTNFMFCVGCLFRYIIDTWSSPNIHLASGDGDYTGRLVLTHFMFCYFLFQQQIIVTFFNVIFSLKRVHITCFYISLGSFWLLETLITWTSCLEPFYVLFWSFFMNDFKQVPMDHHVHETAATLFCCETLRKKITQFSIGR